MNYHRAAWVTVIYWSVRSGWTRGDGGESGVVLSVSFGRPPKAEPNRHIDALITLSPVKPQRNTSMPANTQAPITSTPSRGTRRKIIVQKHIYKINRTKLNDRSLHDQDVVWLGEPQQVKGINMSRRTWRTNLTIRQGTPRNLTATQELLKSLMVYEPWILNLIIVRSQALGSERSEQRLGSESWVPHNQTIQMDFGCSNWRILRRVPSLPSFI